MLKITSRENSISEMKEFNLYNFASETINVYKAKT